MRADMAVLSKHGKQASIQGPNKTTQPGPRQVAAQQHGRQLLWLGRRGAGDAIGKPKGTQLKVSVTAAPKDGKATDHMVRFLAPLFGVAVADIEVVFGQENVNKQLRIRAPKKLPAVFTDSAKLAD
jgi:uncharacterized protein